MKNGYRLVSFRAACVLGKLVPDQVYRLAVPNTNEFKLFRVLAIAKGVNHTDHETEFVVYQPVGEIGPCADQVYVTPMTDFIAHKKD